MDSTTQTHTNPDAAVLLTELVDRIRQYHPAAEIEAIQKAYVFSARMHEGQTRKSGEPYFYHPVRVAKIATELRLDTASVCAALLHDTVEDTQATLADIEEVFGAEVASLVDGVTKLGRINFISKEDQQAESFRKMLVAMARDIRVLLVKLADRIDNMRTLDYMAEAAQERIARETSEIYAPLAGRLGIQWVRDELEELSLRYLFPQAYASIMPKYQALLDSTRGYIEETSAELQRIAQASGFDAKVTGRVKAMFSIYRKMRQNHCAFEDIHDVIAFRVITKNVAECYGVLGSIHSHFTPVPGRFKDYIALPKPNRYQSLHTTVIGPKHQRIEVQIRTDEMHRVAELGVAAHWAYKESAYKDGQKVHGPEFEKFSWLRSLMEVQKEVPDPAEFLESVKVDLFVDEVYAFTPNGDVKVFPRGATPLDFAYSIHSQIGDHCTGARVNGVMVPLRHVLRNGDTVEILTSPNQHPTKDWLEIVVTSRARSKIRGYLRQNERVRGIRLGKELLDSEARKRHVPLARIEKGGELEKHLGELKVSTFDELLAAIGYGRVSAKDVIDVVDQSKAPEPDKATTPPGFLQRTEHKVTRGEGDSIRIGNLHDVLVRFARCCEPVPGDPIIGWITRGRGITIHRRDCPRALDLDPERRVDVSWSGDTNIKRPVSLRITSEDRTGMLVRLSEIFTSRGINITEVSCRVLDDGRAVNNFHCTIGDASNLRSLMKALAKVEGVHDVERV